MPSPVSHVPTPPGLLGLNPVDVHVPLEWNVMDAVLGAAVLLLYSPEGRLALKFRTVAPRPAVAARTAETILRHIPANDALAARYVHNVRNPARGQRA